MKRYLLIGLIFSSFSNIVHSQDIPNVREIVSVHLNTNSLVTGETLLFSANVVSAMTKQYSVLSSILYVELIDAKGKPVYQSKVSLKNGIGHGDIFMTSLISTGTYELYVYTKWMRNFDDYFHTSVQVINPFEEYQPPAKAEANEVKFYPECGIILSEVENLVVVKVKDKNGEGLVYKARIVDLNNETITEFASTENGFGRFLFTPEKDKSYRLILEEKGGDFQFVELPPIENSGSLLRVKQSKNAYMVSFFGKKAESSLVLKVQHNQMELLDQIIIPNTSFTIPKTRLMPGVCRLIVLDGTKMLAERLIFNQPADKVIMEAGNEKYATRSLVTYPVDLKESAKISVSVRRTYEELPNGSQSTLSNLLLEGISEKFLFGPELLSSGNAEQMDNFMLMCNYQWENLPELKNARFLPEHRGEIISGRLNKPDSTPQSENYVAFSILGKDYQVRAGAVDDNGQFSIIIDSYLGDRKAYISSLEYLNADMIELNNPFMEDHIELNHPIISLDSFQIKELVERSILNQIENAYFELKEDSLVGDECYPEVFGNFDYLYVLDKYNRFPTLRDSFVEYIPSVNARQRKSGYSFHVIPKYVIYGESFEPQIFLDGLPVKAEEILSFSPYRIESIGIINNRCFMGPVIADGIISFKTKEGDLQGFSPGAHTRAIDYIGLSPQKIYSFPKYDDDADLSRIPDFRDQLFWDPEIMVSSTGLENIEFYSSDTKGKFEISIEGFTESGRAVSIRKYFTVE